jgi:phenylpropionate dioxygenase-like ring-hydroxylating dioxygenase large terminal subunit
MVGLSQVQKAENSQRACATSLPTIVQQGLLFVYPGLPENAPKTKVPIVDVLEETEGWICLNTFRVIPYDALTLMENVLDSSHIPYTHHRTVGNRANVSPVELEVTESGKWGFRGTWAEGPRKGTLGRQDTTFIAPGLMWHDLTSKQCSNFTKAFYLPTKADLFVFQLRSWVNQYSVDPFAGKTLAPSLPNEALLDRYHSHTEKCTSCHAALVNLQRLRVGVFTLTGPNSFGGGTEVVVRLKHLPTFITFTIGLVNGRFDLCCCY